MSEDRYGRAHWFLPEELDEEQRDFYDRLTSGPRDASWITDERGRLLGAFNARLLDPPVGTAIQELGAALRFGTRLTPREREIAILEVARAERGGFEWNAHAAAALRAGLDEEQLEALRVGAPAEGLSESESAVRRVARALLERGDLADDEFGDAERAIGPSRIFDVVSVVGHYRHTALAMRVWRVPLRPGDADVFESEGTER